MTFNTLVREYDLSKIEGHPRLLPYFQVSDVNDGTIFYLATPVSPASRSKLVGSLFLEGMFTWRAISFIPYESHEIIGAAISHLSPKEDILIWENKQKIRPGILPMNKDIKVVLTPLNFLEIRDGSKRLLENDYVLVIPLQYFSDATEEVEKKKVSINDQIRPIFGLVAGDDGNLQASYSEEFYEGVRAILKDILPEK